MFRCEHIIMRDAHIETLRTLKQNLSLIGTYPILTEAVIHYIKSWMRQEEPKFLFRLLPYVPSQQKLIHAINEQTKIGWNQFLRGRITTKWREAQQLFHAQTRLNTWIKKFITKIMAVNQTIWDVRNSLLYGTGTNKTKKARGRLIPTITTYYKTYKNLVHPTHYHIFQIPLETIITFSSTENKQWIDTVKAAKTYYKRQQKLYFLTHRKITKYFKTTKKAPQLRPQEYIFQ